MAHPVVRRSSGCEPHVTLDRAEAMAKIFFPLSIRYFKYSLLSSYGLKYVQKTVRVYSRIMLLLRLFEIFIALPYIKIIQLDFLDNTFRFLNFR